MCKQKLVLQMGKKNVKKKKQPLNKDIEGKRVMFILNTGYRKIMSLPPST